MISCLQYEGSKILTLQIDREKYIKVLYVSELILCYREWLKLGKFWKRSDITTFNNAQKAIETLANQIIKLMPRSTGNGWNIPKLHELIHAIENILLWGAARNVHTGPQEHNHILNTKKPSKQVQRKKKTLDWQLGN